MSGKQVDENIEKLLRIVNELSFGSTVINNKLDSIAKALVTHIEDNVNTLQEMRADITKLAEKILLFETTIKELKENNVKISDEIKEHEKSILGSFYEIKTRINDFEYNILKKVK